MIDVEGGEAGEKIDRSRYEAGERPFKILERQVVRDS